MGALAAAALAGSEDPGEQAATEEPAAAPAPAAAAAPRAVGRAAQFRWTLEQDACLRDHCAPAGLIPREGDHRELRTCRRCQGWDYRIRDTDSSLKYPQCARDASEHGCEDSAVHGCEDAKGCSDTDDDASADEVLEP